MKWMLKNSAGKPDGIWTMTVVSWLLCSVLLALSIVQGSVKIKDVADLTLKPVDGALFAAYIGATFASYVVRRNKKDMIDANQDGVPDDEEEIDIERNG